MEIKRKMISCFIVILLFLINFCSGCSNHLIVNGGDTDELKMIHLVIDDKNIHETEDYDYFTSQLKKVFKKTFKSVSVKTNVKDVDDNILVLTPLFLTESIGGRITEANCRRSFKYCLFNEEL